MRGMGGRHRVGTSGLGVRSTVRLLCPLCYRLLIKQIDTRCNGGQVSCRTGEGRVGRRGRGGSLTKALRPAKRESESGATSKGTLHVYGTAVRLDKTSRYG
jgi:hypothetical protein